MRRSLLSIVLLALGVVGVVGRAPVAHAVTPSTCPLASPPSAGSSWPWLSASYQTQFTPMQLAQQVYDCEQRFHPTTALAANVALTGLRTVTGTQWQNENDWLVGATAATFLPDYPSLGIPPITMEDGPSGVRYGRPGDSPTNYPNELALAATFDPSLATRYGATLAAQAATMGFQGVQIPDLNIARTPNWGRAMESFGENPTLAGIMGSAEVTGALTQLPFVVLKHVGTYSQETDRRTLTMTVSSSALMNIYLRPFAMAIAAGQSVRPAGVMVMCSYGIVNTAPTCVSPQLASALRAFHFNGVVRSDLDVTTTGPVLWAHQVALVKPQTLLNLGPLTSLTSVQRASLTGAALAVLRYQFAAGLVTPDAVVAAEHPGVITPTARSAGDAAALATEERGAVLLRNTGNALPLTAAAGTIAVVASRDFPSTCMALAAALVQQGHHATCHVVTPLSAPVTPLVSGGRINQATTPITVTRRVTVPTTGPVLITDTSVGRSTLTINGVTVDTLVGSSELAVPHTFVLNVRAGETLTCTTTYAAQPPWVWMQPLTPALNAALAAVAHSDTAIVLANDQAREGADRTTLALPDGQDQIISTIAATVPTTVGLLTTGPVLLPWLSAVRGLVEFWNPAGDPTADGTSATLVPAMVRLLTGQVDFSGHLPFEWPTSDATSPLGGGVGGNFFPGVSRIVNLSVTPLNGNALGFEWYQRARWPVAFPFGFGLQTQTSHSTLTGATCATPTSTSLCLAVATRLANPTGTEDTAVTTQLYVASPNGPTTPRLLLGALATTPCQVSGVVTAACSTGTTPLTVTALTMGQWSTTTQTYTIGAGCYTFLLATDANQASSMLSGAVPPSGVAVHATAPFGPATTLSPGLCPH
jgi:beta-glucosidase